jgi:hypothetical protein
MAFTDVLKKSFPFISAAASLGGPLGTMAASLVGNALGLTKTPANNGDSISNAIALAFADPTQRAALLKAEQDFQVQMQQLGYQHSEEIEQIAEKDRDSARNREIQVKDWTPRILAFIVVILCFGGEGFYFMHGSPANASGELIGRILGTLDSALILVLSYYFGSSAGSDDKTKTLSAIASSKP